MQDFARYTLYEDARAWGLSVKDAQSLTKAWFYIENSTLRDSRQRAKKAFGGNPSAAYKPHEYRALVAEMLRNHRLHAHEFARWRDLVATYESRRREPKPGGKPLLPDLPYSVKP